MNTVTIRTLRETEIDEVCQLWAKVFPEKKEFFLERLYRENNYDLRTTWVAIKNKKIVASVQIFPYHMYYGPNQLKVAGIGNVATDPAHRGQGLTQIIMKRQLDWMKKQGFHVSFLSTDIHAFYEKLGWRKFPLPVYSCDRPTEVNVTSENVHPFQEQDLAAIKQLYETFNKQFSGGRIRTDVYWTNIIPKETDNHTFLFVYKEQDEVVSYIRYFHKNDVCVIEECCYKEMYEDSIYSLVQAMIGKHSTCQRLRFRFAKTHMLLDERGSGQIQQDTTSMVKIIDFKHLFIQMKDEFSQIIKEREITILFQIDSTDLLVSKQDSIIDIQIPTENFTYDVVVKYSEEEFISMLFEGENIRENLVSLQKYIPTLPYQFWTTDAF